MRAGVTVLYFFCYNEHNQWKIGFHSGFVIYTENIKHMIQKYIVIFSGMFFLASCSTSPLTKGQYHHSLNVQVSGKPWKKRNRPNGEAIPSFEYQVNAIGCVKKVDDTIKDNTDCIITDDHNKNNDKDYPYDFNYKGFKRVMVFIHGGLNFLRDREDKIPEMLETINIWNKNNSDEKIYPIFVNWHSLLNNSGDRLIKVRNGEINKWLAIPTSPFAVLSDAGRVAGRLPEVYFKEITEMFRFGRDVAKRPEGWNGSNISIYKDADYPSFPSTDQGWFWHPATIPSYPLRLFPGIVRAGALPILDFFLYESYQMMLRRIEMLFRTESDFKCAKKGFTVVKETKRECKSSGALSQLMEKLKKDGKKITLIGHSMGAIVVNEIIRRYPNNEIDNIVYMAAACTSKDFIDTIPPYLDRKNKDNIDKPVKFYSLTLHPYADKDEVTAFYTFPSGSLLEWLDIYVHRVKTPLDLTFGKWNNAMKVLPFLNDFEGNVTNNIFIKGFPVDKSKFPAKHGDFDDYIFWDSRFWDVENKLSVPTQKEYKKFIDLHEFILGSG